MKLYGDTIAFLLLVASIIMLRFQINLYTVLSCMLIAFALLFIFDSDGRKHGAALFTLCGSLLGTYAVSWLIPSNITGLLRLAILVPILLVLVLLLTKYGYRQKTDHDN